jgi:hypothetical protein
MIEIEGKGRHEARSTEAGASVQSSPFFGPGQLAYDVLRKYAKGETIAP